MLLGLDSIPRSCCNTSAGLPTAVVQDAFLNLIHKSVTPGHLLSLIQWQYIDLSNRTGKTNISFPMAFWKTLPNCSLNKIASGRWKWEKWIKSLEAIKYQSEVLIFKKCFWKTKQNFILPYFLHYQTSCTIN